LAQEGETVNLPTSTTILIVAVIVLVIGVVLGMTINRKIRTQRLKRRFGPEYDRALEEHGDPKQAERELESRLDHVKSLDIRSLSHDEADRLAHEWRRAQAQFVDEPFAALQKANSLIREVMAARGYDVDDFDQRVADLSVDYPGLVTDYRDLHDLARGPEKKGLETEDLRQAMLRGKDLFEKLAEEKIDRHVKEKEEA
jgi:hypothetical protein